MTMFLKKITMIIPVIFLTIIFVNSKYTWEYDTMGIRGVIEISLNLLPLYVFVIFDLIKRRTSSIFDMLIQTSFYIYVLSVVKLTIYFILFRKFFFNELYGAGWSYAFTLSLKNATNLIPFTIFKTYGIFHKQVIGNLIMFIPLGIYLPLLYKKIDSYKKVLMVGLITSISIELIQLFTGLGFRGADIDDVILNTLGTVIGFGLYNVGMDMFKKHLLGTFDNSKACK